MYVYVCGVWYVWGVYGVCGGLYDVCVCTCTQCAMPRSEVDFGYLSLSALSFETGSLTELEPPIQIDWLAESPRDPPVSTFLELG